MNYFTAISSVAAAVRLAHEPVWRDKTIVVILPDSGRYLSAALFILTGR